MAGPFNTAQRQMLMRRVKAALEQNPDDELLFLVRRKRRKQYLFRKVFFGTGRCAKPYYDCKRSERNPKQECQRRETIAAKP